MDGDENRGPRMLTRLDPAEDERETRELERKPHFIRREPLDLFEMSH